MTDSDWGPKYPNASRVSKRQLEYPHLDSDHLYLLPVQPSLAYWPVANVDPDTCAQEQDR
jgi:hypothetical protein